MSTVNDVKTQLDNVHLIVSNVAADVSSLQTQVSTLKEQIENGGVATQADIDAIAEKVLAIKTSLAAIDEQEPVVPAPE